METNKNYILEYVDQINSGQIVVSDRIRKWYNKIADRIKTGNCGRWHFNLDRAVCTVEFIEVLYEHLHGKPSRGFVELDLWQKALFQTLFGFEDDAGNLQFKEAIDHLPLFQV